MQRKNTGKAFVIVINKIIAALIIAITTILIVSGSAYLITIIEKETLANDLHELNDYMRELERREKALKEYYTHYLHIQEDYIRVMREYRIVIEYLKGDCD
jgi:hypothetical protein